MSSLLLLLFLLLQSQKQVGSALSTIAHSQAMMAAVRDYAKVWAVSCVAI